VDNRKLYTYVLSIGAKSKTLDGLEQPLRTLLHKTSVFRAYYKNLNEDKPILSATICSLGTLVSGKIRFMRRGGSLDRRRQTTVWLSTTAIFSDFAGYGYVFGNFRDKARIFTE